MIVPITQRLVSKRAPNKSMGSRPQTASSPAVAGPPLPSKSFLCPKGEARPGHCGVRSYLGPGLNPG